MSPAPSSPQVITVRTADRDDLVRRRPPALAVDGLESARDLGERARVVVKPAAGEPDLMCWGRNGGLFVFDKSGFVYEVDATGAASAFCEAEV